MMGFWRDTLTGLPDLGSLLRLRLVVAWLIRQFSWRP